MTQIVLGEKLVKLFYSLYSIKDLIAYTCYNSLSDCVIGFLLNGIILAAFLCGIILAAFLCKKCMQAEHI